MSTRLPAESYALLPNLKNGLFFAIGERSRIFVVCFVHTCGQMFFSRKPGQRPSHITGRRVDTVTLGWIGAPNEQVPVQISLRSCSFCRSVSVEDLESRRFKLNISLSFPQADLGPTSDRRQWKRDVVKKKFEFQIYPPKNFCTARYEHNFWKEKFQTFQKAEKNIPGQILGQDRPEKKSAKCSFEAARFRVFDRHRSTQPTTAP